MTTLRNNLFFFFFVFSFVVSYAQDESEEHANSDGFTEKELHEENQYMEFKNYFMESQREKAIENYNRALEYMNQCESIYPENLAMLYEKAHLHFLLKQYAESHGYCDKALAQKPDFFWIKELKKNVYSKENNFPAALELQKQLYATDASQAGNLLQLYMLLNDIENGRKTLNEAEKNIIFIENKDTYLKFFFPERTKAVLDTTMPSTNIVPQTQDQFQHAKASLEQLFLSGKYDQLEQESKGLFSQYPAEPLIYYYNGLASNQLKKHAQAVTVLENGLDFVFDTTVLTIKFYQELIKAYHGVNNPKKVDYYKQLVQKLQK